MTKHRIDLAKAARYNRKMARNTLNLWTWDDLPIAWRSKLPARKVESKEFAQAVAQYQLEQGLTVDGMLGPATLRYLLTTHNGGERADGVVIGGDLWPVPFPLVHLPGLRAEPRAAPPHQVVLHVDVTWASENAYEILKGRRLSSHFGIDGDRGRDGYATVYQWLDPLGEYGVHAGTANRTSIGIDVNTPLEMKRQNRDKRQRMRARPVVEAEVRGRNRKNLGFFDEQVKSLIALADLFERALEIPRRWPREPDGTIITEQLTERKHKTTAAAWRGWTGHHHHPTSHYCPGAAGVVIVDQLCPVDVVDIEPVE